MKFASLRVLALASMASLAMATSSSAVHITEGTILQFGQVNPEDRVTATAAAGTTTLTTNSGPFPGSIPITITNLGGDPVLLDALETLENVVSTGTATSVDGSVRQTFSGTIRITSLTGTNVLTATFTNAVFTGAGGSGALSGSQPPQSVTFSSGIPTIQALIDANAERNFSLSFSNISPPLSVSGGTINSFTAENVGTFAVGPAAVIPEPSGIVMAGTAMLVSLGCVVRRRRQLARA